MKKFRGRFAVVLDVVAHDEDEAERVMRNAICIPSLPQHGHVHIDSISTSEIYEMED